MDVCLHQQSSRGLFLMQICAVCYQSDLPLSDTKVWAVPRDVV